MTKLEEIQLEVEKEIAHQREFMRPWAKVWCSVWQDGPGVHVTAYGTTEDGRFFKTWFELRMVEELKPSYIRTYAANALLSLDSFLDPKCECKPTPGQYIGEHCEFHRRMFGD